MACDLSSGRRPLPGGRIYSRSGWIVEHCMGPLGIGTLILKPERHVTAVADLLDEEVAELGPLLRLTSAVAAELAGTEQVYNCLWSHGADAPVHLHYVVQPVTAAQAASFEARGPRLQAAMFEANQPLDVHDVEDAAERARELFRTREKVRGDVS